LVLLKTNCNESSERFLVQVLDIFKQQHTMIYTTIYEYSVTVLAKTQHNEGL